MSSREKILAQIKENKPSNQDLPEVPFFVEKNGDFEQFKAVLASIGGKTVEIQQNGIADFVKNNFPETYKIASNLIDGNFVVSTETTNAEIKQVDLAVLKGEIGVAENGAIWLPESNMINRALPFITQHLILVLKKKAIVPNMHYAYAAIKSIGNYGVFIAGPSKTADIEQSLVIGAHGARSMTVLLI